MGGVTSQNSQVGPIGLTLQQVILVNTGWNLKNYYLKAHENDQTRKILEWSQHLEEGKNAEWVSKSLNTVKVTAVPSVNSVGLKIIRLS